MNDNNVNEIHRLSGLDALRGIAIVGIVLYHLYPAIFPGGFLGVPLFFVLSGYLMFTTSDRHWEKGDFHFGNYYKKRFLKIFPPLFITVIAVCSYMTLFQREQMAGIRQELCSIFFGYNNWWQINENSSYFSRLINASPFTHLWFLAIEMQFYLLWPVIFWLYQKACKTFGGNRMCFLFLLLSILSAGRMWYLYTPGEDPSRVYYGTDTMAFPMLLGIFWGAFNRQFKRVRLPAVSPKKAAILLSGFVFVTIMLFFSVTGISSIVYQGGMFLVSLFFLAMLCITESLEESVAKWLDVSLLSKLGAKSYLIYLWHYPIIILANL
jgi:peptidoglycan/LPS O-acetylase OafA/YrhL